MKSGDTAGPDHREDRGYSVVERGTDQIPARNVNRVLLLLLALAAAAANVALLVYNASAAQQRLPSSDWRPDISNHSNIVNHLCGPGAPHECPPGKRP